MSTATIAGCSGADKHIGEARHDPHAAPRRRADRTKATIHPPAQPSTPASHACLVGSRIGRHAGTAFATPLRCQIWRPTHDLSSAPQRALHAGIERPRHREGAHLAGRRRDPRSRGRGGARGQGAGAPAGRRRREGRRLRRPRGVHPGQRHRHALARRRSQRRRARRAGRASWCRRSARSNSSNGSASACST